MSARQGIVNCPPGLECLAAIDQLLVHQKADFMGAFGGFNNKKKFIVKNTSDENIYCIVEDLDFLERNFSGTRTTPLKMSILDKHNKEVIHVSRPVTWQQRCLPFAYKITTEVSAPPGTIVSTIEQEKGDLRPTLTIKDASGQICLKIECPFSTYNVGNDVDFKITTADGNIQVGKISKRWSGLGREMFSDADDFSINFPMDLAVRMKAAVLGACLVIDDTFFKK